MHRAAAVLAVAGAIALGACANGGDPTDNYDLPQGDDGAGSGGEGGSDSSVGASSSGSSSGGSSTSSSSGGSGSSSGGDDAGSGDDGGGDEGGSGSDGGDGGGSPTSCMSSDTCSANAMALMSIAGDQSGPTDNATGTTSEWLRIDLTEQDNSVTGHPMRITAVLTSPSGENFDLYAYLGSSVGDIQCTNPKGQSQNPAGQTDTVTFDWGETGTFANGSDDSATVMLEVRAASGTTCSSGSSWSLAVHGN